MKKRMQRFGALLLSLSLVVSTPAAALAEETTSTDRKDEIVYVSTDLSGQPKGVYVVNAFRLGEAGTIRDYGNYESVENLSNVNPIRSKDGQQEVKAESGKFFYQGNNPEKKLPWNIELHYFLEGKEVKPEELAGKSGTFSIQGKMEADATAESTYKDYYVLQASFNFDSRYVKLTETEGATLAYNGSTQMLTYLVLPGKTFHFQIEGQTKDFRMQAFQISAIPFNMNVDLPDTDVLTDQLGQLEDGIAQINRGAAKVEQGSGKLSSTGRLLVDNLARLTQGAQQASAGQSQFGQGQALFHQGLVRYARGIDEASAQFQKMSVGLTQLKDGMVRLQGASNTLAQGSVEYTKGLNRYLDGVAQAGSGQAAFQKGLSQFVQQGQGLRQGGDQLRSGSQQILEGLSAFDNFPDFRAWTREDMNKLADMMEKAINYWDLVREQLDQMDYAAFKKDLGIAEGLLEEIDHNLNLLKNSMSRDQLIKKLGIQDPENEDVKKLLKEYDTLEATIIDAGQKTGTIHWILKAYLQDDKNLQSLYEKLKGQYEEMKRLLTPIVDALRKFKGEEAYELLQNLSTFKDRYSTFHQGLVKYTEGVNQTMDALEGKVLPGAQKLSGGLQELGKQKDSLLSGMNRIASGQQALSTGLGKITRQLNLGDLSRVNQLKQGIDQLLTAHCRLLTGQEGLKTGLQQLSSGLGQYETGLARYTNGIDQLAGGMKRLVSGTSTMEEETQGMSDKAKQQIEDALRAFKKEGYRAKSFVDDRNKNIGTVQFVYLSDAIEPKVVEKEAEKPVEKGFLEKLLDLFR